MTDEIDRRLRHAFDRPLPTAPGRLRVALDDLPAHVRARTQISPLWVAAISVAFVAAIAIIANIPRAVQTTPTAAPSPLVTESPTVRPSNTPLTVSAFLARLKDGDRDGSILLEGYWTDRLFRHSCAAPIDRPGDLELYCFDGEFGITELKEPIGTLRFDGRWIVAAGPAITPFVEERFRDRLLGLPTINGQEYPPVPIVVRGHVDDPRANDCRPVARQMCLDRFVIDEIVEFDPTSVPTPGVTPPPSPFPFDDPPPPPFDKASCSGDVPYSFVGWGYLTDLGLKIGDPDEVVYMMVTAGDVDLGDAGQGPRGRRVCFAREWEQGSVSYAPLPAH